MNLKEFAILTIINAFEFKDKVYLNISIKLDKGWQVGK